MKLNRLFIVRMVALACFVGIWLYKTQTMLFQITDCSVSCDPLFSQNLCVQIQGYIKDLQARNKGVSLATMNEQVQKQFPCISSVTSLFLLPEKVHIACTAVQPKLRVNDQLVLCDHNAYFGKDIFTPAVVAALPGMQCRSVSTEGALPVGLQGAGSKITQAIIDGYSIVWHSDYYALLHDKHESNFVVVCSADSIPSDATLFHCERLKNNLIESRSLKHDGPVQWVADVRFNNQIIVYSQKRG